jgi:hypothetical protein
VTRQRLVSGLAVVSASSTYLAARDHNVLLAVIPAVASVLCWRWARRHGVGMRWRAAALVLAALLAITTAWLVVMALVIGAAGIVRNILPIRLEEVMRAIPGNAPEAWASLLGGEPSVGAWASFYLAGFTAVPVLALAWAAARGARTVALLVVGSHVSTFLLCLPIFIMLPVPDPWYGSGWWFGEPCPWWWKGMHQQLVTFCFPSLHMAVGTAVVLAMGRLDRAWWIRAAWLTWLVLLACSTIALRTHWLIDLPIGVAVGVAAHVLGQRLLRWHWHSFAEPKAAVPSSGNQTVRPAGLTATSRRYTGLEEHRPNRMRPAERG